MSPVNILSGIAGAINTFLQDELIKQWGEATMQAIAHFASFVIGGFNGLVWARNQEDGAVKYSDTYAQKIATDVVQMETALEYSISHVAFTLLPHSLLYMLTWIRDTWFKPVWDWQKRAEGQITYLFTWVGQIWDWRNNRVDPELHRLDTFLTDFFKGDQPSLNVLIDWLRYPGHFGDWAAAPVIGPIVAYLAANDHDTTRDNLAQIMLRAWREQPQRTLDEIEAWLVQPIK